MKVLFFMLVLLAIPVLGRATPVSLSRQDKRNGLIYSQTITADVDFNSSFFKKYRPIQKHINLQVDFPEAVIFHQAKDEKDVIEFQKKYSTNRFGFRKTTVRENAHQRLIIAGDSNTFGIGCNDDETLSFFLEQKLPETQIENLGLAGSGPNSLLYFLQHYSLAEVKPSIKDTLMLYDFSEYLIERMIGGKNFIRWGWMQPAYELEGNELHYAGTFNEQWISKFYKVINFVDPKNFLFPNLPRIHDHHYQLVARIFLEIKKLFLQQTKMNNRFAVLIHPFTLNEQNRPVVKRVEEELKKLGIETIRFDESTAINYISIYPRDLHMKPDGQYYYAGLIAQKVQNIFASE